nr:MAG TPA: tail protein [Caudoviricetes sp.]
MIPRIYDNSFTTYESNGLGLLVDAISCQVEEESNGDFELTLVYPSDGSFFYALKQDNLVKADASDNLKGQLFRIDTISKPLNGQVTVYAKHISFDLAKNSLNEDVNEKNIKCENAGKHMLQKSDADSRFTIESNIEMLGNYSMDRKTDCLSAIAGTRGSLIDTFGNGPKLLRDNFTISVLTRRGKDDNTLIAYKKNITGFTLEEDYSEIINIIKPYATYTEDEVEKTLYIDETGVKSPRYVEGDIVKSQWMDFSDKFDEDEAPTKEKLKNLAEKYFNDNSCDLPKMTYKIEFQPLSQTEEYKEDGLAELEYIGMDDSVYIANSKYGIRDQARVIKTTYNVLADKYISIELGDPKTTLGSIINKNNTDTVTKDEVKDIVDKTNKKDYPNTLPAVPVVTIDRAGFKTVSLSWTFDNKPYYSYQVYASQEQGFSPNAFDLIYEGKGSAFLHEVECSQTWYYRVRAINTYGNATDFSEEVSATTTKISDAAEYFQEAAIESALIGSLNADVINAGKLKGTFIDARQLTVTDGNGNITFLIDSEGNVSIRATEFSLEGKTISSYIDDVTTDISEQKERINKILEDGTLIPSEKRQLQIILDDIAEEYAEITANALKYNIAYNDFQTAYNALYNYLTVDCKINDIEITTNVHQDTLKNYFENYYTKRGNINNLINDKINSNIDDKLSSSDSEAVFNALTKNGTIQGLYMQDGKLYFNGQYINAKNLKVIDSKGNTTFYIDSNGNVTINATDFSLEGKTIDDYVNSHVVEVTGITMKRVSISYYISTSPTQLLGGSWSTTKPTWVSGKYIWQKTVTTYSNNTTSESEPVCITGPKGEQGTPGGKGDQGVSITRVSNRYGKSTSKIDPPTTWYTNYPEWERGYYIWTKSIIYYSDGTATETTPYVDTSWEGMANLVDNKVDNTQQAIFNALTNNGQVQGIYLQNGKVYLNGEYIKTNSLNASNITFDDLTGKTIKGARFFTAPKEGATDGYLFRIYSDGSVYSSKTIQVYGESNDGSYAQLTPGKVTATEYLQSPGLITSNNSLYFGVQGYTPLNDNSTRMVKLTRDANNEYTYFMPCYNPTSTSGGIRLGSTNGFWNVVYATNGVKTSSDRTLKENIDYLDGNSSIDYDDLYNFIKNDYSLATYNYIGESEKRLSAIAQDMLVNSDGTDNKVGQLITNAEEAYKNQATLAIEETQLVNVLIGALKKTMEKVEELENKLNSK